VLLVLLVLFVVLLLLLLLLLLLEIEEIALFVLLGYVGVKSELVLLILIEVFVLERRVSCVFPNVGEVWVCVGKGSTQGTKLVIDVFVLLGIEFAGVWQGWRGKDEFCGVGKGVGVVLGVDGL